MDDWRITFQDKYLKNAEVEKRKYRPPNKLWDHDHCAFCWEKFSRHPDDLHEGYCTLDEYYWICESCFADFQEKFHWKVQPGQPAIDNPSVTDQVAESAPIEATCEECGGKSIFPPETHDGIQTCPHCGKYLDVKGSN
jgi:hypothetical protein